MEYSDKVSGQKSKFSRTCSLLSQYLKENGSFPDLTLGTPTATTTMNLLPMIEKSGESAARNSEKPMNLFNAFGKEENTKKTDSSVTKSETDKTQIMTIFYGGQVIVYNDLPEDKAKEIMHLARNGSSNYHFAMVPSKEPAEFANHTLIQEQHPSSHTFVSGLPYTRTPSLTRFLEKRKHRLAARAPYQICKDPNQATTSNEEESKAWLGLGAPFPLKTEE